MSSEQVLQWVWNIGGPFIPVVFFLYLFYTNKIYTKKAYDDMVLEKNKTIEDKDIKLAEYWEMFKSGIIVAEKALDEAKESKREVRRR